jgi:acetyl-CoA carboxylase carboxyl transferase subunit beta
MLQAKLDAIPEGLWTRCPGCQELLFTPTLERNLKVCERCYHHSRLTARERIGLLLDEGSFVEEDADLQAAEPFRVPDLEVTRISDPVETGLDEAVVTGRGTLNGVPVSIGLADCHGRKGEGRAPLGSAADTAAERITRAVERAIEFEMPVILGYGGARTLEGPLALLHTVKTCVAMTRLHQAGLMAIVLLTDGTMPGALPTWGSLGDLILVEAGDGVGFTGRRAARAAQAAPVSADLEVAELQLKQGRIDTIVPRRELKRTIGNLLLFGTAAALTSVPRRVPASIAYGEMSVAGEARETGRQTPLEATAALAGSS